MHHEQDYLQQTMHHTLEFWWLEDITCWPCRFSSVLADTEVEYGNIEKITITRGKVHKYLGMTIDYSSPGKVIFSMVEYIGKMLYDIPEDMKGVSATLAAHQLLDIL